MKINDNLVGLFNARLQDLRFEVETAGTLFNIEEDEELTNEFNQLDITKSLREQFPVEYRMVEREGLDENDEPYTYEEEEEVEIPYETRGMFVLKQIIHDMNLKKGSEVLDMISKRAGIKLKDIQDAVKLFQETEEHVKLILQTDYVVNYLVSLGLTSYALHEIQKVKDSKLNELCKILAIETKEELND